VLLQVDLFCPPPRISIISISVYIDFTVAITFPKLLNLFIVEKGTLLRFISDFNLLLWLRKSQLRRSHRAFAVITHRALKLIQQRL
jgi:hypothetical protein